MHKILVVDDEKAMLGLIRTNLSEVYEVIDTEDRKQALALNHNASAQRHFEGISERGPWRKSEDSCPPERFENLEKIYHRSNFIVWGLSSGSDERSALGEDGTGRRGAHLQQRPDPFRGRDRLAAT
jgi:hypothetical protein